MTVISDSKNILTGVKQSINHRIQQRRLSTSWFSCTRRTVEWNWWFYCILG